MQSDSLSMINKTFLGQALRFATSGAMATVTHVIVAASLIQFLGVGPTEANSIAFCVAMLLSFTANTLWSFSSPMTGKTFVRFVIVSLFGLFLTRFVSGLAESYGLNYWIGIGGVVCTVPPVMFLLHKYWTYR